MLLLFINILFNKHKKIKNKYIFKIVIHKKIYINYNFYYSYQYLMDDYYIIYINHYINK